MTLTTDLDHSQIALVPNREFQTTIKLANAESVLSVVFLHLPQNPQCLWTPSPPPTPPLRSSWSGSLPPVLTATSPTTASSVVSRRRTATSTNLTTAYKVSVRILIHSNLPPWQIACCSRDLCLPDFPSRLFLLPRNEAAVSYPDPPGQWRWAEVEPHRWAHLRGQVLRLPQDRQPAEEGAGRDRVSQDLWELPPQWGLWEQVRTPDCNCSNVWPTNLKSNLLMF